MLKHLILYLLLCSVIYSSNNRILLITNDNSTSSGTLIAHIRDFGYRVDIASADAITYSQMIQYNAVVVAFGKNQYPILSTNFRLNLVEYILNGHKTLIEGGEIAAITQGDTTYHGFKTKALRLRQWLAHAGGNLILNPSHYGSTLATYPNVLPASYGINFTENKDQDVNLPDIYSQVLYYNSGNSNTSGVLAYPGVQNPTLIYFSFCYTSSSDMITAKKLLENCLYSLTGYVIGVGPVKTYIPEKYWLFQNYPNPFNPFTTVEFDIPETSDITLKIHDITGRELTRITQTNLQPGRYKFTWDASDYPSGIYLIIMEGKEFLAVRKMILLR
ncbi:MAG: T9SS type A sorting domain-containing protein [Ignavibacteria bacterium]|nr:T9SS type A sorting domain-containing protein [Ignavibacteria bacterium]